MKSKLKTGGKFAALKAALIKAKGGDQQDAAKPNPFSK